MRVAVFCASRELYRYLMGCVKSMIKNGRPDKVYLLLEDDEYTEKLPSCVEIINVSGQTYFTKDNPNMNNKRFTYMAMMRAALPLILPKEIDKCLSLDCDLVIHKDIDEVWDKDISGYYLAATPEPYMCRWEKKYYNTGVSLLNLKKLREDGITEKMIEDLNHNKYRFPEQDTYNKWCAGHIMDMPSEFNYNDYVAKPLAEVRIRHFAGNGANIWGYLPEITSYINMPWEQVLGGRSF